MERGVKRVLGHGPGEDTVHVLFLHRSRVHVLISLPIYFVLDRRYHVADVGRKDWVAHPLVTHLGIVPVAAECITVTVIIKTLSFVSNHASEITKTILTLHPTAV